MAALAALEALLPGMFVKDRSRPAAEASESLQQTNAKPRKPEKKSSGAAARKKTHSYTAPPPSPQGQGSGRRSVADNARFGAQ